MSGMYMARVLIQGLKNVSHVNPTIKATAQTTLTFSCLFFSLSSAPDWRGLDETSSSVSYSQ